MKTQYGFFLFVVCLLSFSSCKQTTLTNTELVTLRFDALNKHDLAALENLYSDSALIESPNLSAPEKGKNGIHSVYSRYFKSSPDLVYTITKILPGDSSVSVEFTSTGTMKYLEDGGPAYMLDKKYSLHNCTILEIRNHKIVRDASYFDQVSFLRQVGFFEQH